MSGSRVWVITGASSGLGLAMALYMLQQGDKVVATVRSVAKFPAVLKEAGARPLVLSLDSSDEVIQKAAEEAIQIYGHVDVLVNNAGTNNPGYGPVEEVSMGDIRQQFQSNLFGTLAFTQPFIAHMRTRRTGHIFNVSSVGAVSCAPSWGAYCASKSALESFSDALASELTLFNVRVFILSPGYFPTNIFRTHPAYIEDGGTKEASAAQVTTVYTDRATQGYDSMNWLPRYSESTGLVGEPEKLAARVFEITAGVGFAKKVMDERGKAGWTRVLCGTDCGSIVLKKLEDTVENIKAFEPIWRSTDAPRHESLDAK